MEAPFHRTSIARKLTLAIIVVASLLLVQFGGVYLSGQKYVEGVSAIHDAQKASITASQIRQITVSLSDMLQRARPSSAEASWRVFDELSAQARAKLTVLASYARRDPELARWVGQAAESLAQLGAAASRAHVAAFGESARGDLLLANQFGIEATEALEKLRLAVEKQSDRVFEGLYLGRYQPLLVEVTMTALFLALAIAGGLAFIRSLIRSLTNLMNATVEVTRGNLAFQAPVTSRDELGMLTRAFNGMIRSLKESTVSRQYLETVNHALIAANKDLEAFSYSVSHDLRAPLRSMDGFSRAVLQSYADRLDERGRDYLNRIRESSKRMDRLIDDLLNLSRLSRAEMHRSEVDLGTMASAVVAELRAREPDRRVDFEVEPAMIVSGDANLLRVVMENLLGNAWKYTSRHPRATIVVGTALRDGKRVVYVRDDGAGFDMAYADKLFGAFQRLHGTSEFAGTGIGLALVRRIIHRHGGEVWAHGEVDKGATIYFTLGEAGGIGESAYHLAS